MAPATDPRIPDWSAAPADSEHWQTKFSSWAISQPIGRPAHEQVWFWSPSQKPPRWVPSTLHASVIRAKGTRLPTSNTNRTDYRGPAPDWSTAPAGAEHWQTIGNSWAVTFDPTTTALIHVWNGTDRTWRVSKMSSYRGLQREGVRLPATETPLPPASGDTIEVRLTGKVSTATTSGDGLWFTETNTGRSLFLAQDMLTHVTVTERAPEPDPALEPGDLLTDARGRLYIYDSEPLPDRPFRLLRTAAGKPAAIRLRYPRADLTGPLTAVTTRPRAQQ